MKLSEIKVENRSAPLSEEQKEWILSFVHAADIRTDEEFGTFRGRIETTRNFLHILEFEEPYDKLPESVRFGKIKIFILDGSVTLDNFDILPSESDHIEFKKGCSIPWDLKGLSKGITSCKKITIPEVKTGLLEIMKIKGLKEVFLNKIGSASKFSGAFSIIQHCVRNGVDIFDCQEMMYEQGFKEFC
jgi:hypothetical protein